VSDGDAYFRHFCFCGDRLCNVTKAISAPSPGISWIEQTSIADIDFVDDTSLLAKTRDSLQEPPTNLVFKAKKARLRVSAEKTKTLQMSIR